MRLPSLNEKNAVPLQPESSENSKLRHDLSAADIPTGRDDTHSDCRKLAFAPVCCVAVCGFVGVLHCRHALPERGDPFARNPIRCRHGDVQQAAVVGMAGRCVRPVWPDCQHRYLSEARQRADGTDADARADGHGHADRPFRVVSLHRLSADHAPRGCAGCHSRGCLYGCGQERWRERREELAAVAACWHQRRHGVCHAAANEQPAFGSVLVCHFRRLHIFPVGNGGAVCYRAGAQG